MIFGADTKLKLFCLVLFLFVEKLNQMDLALLVNTDKTSKLGGISTLTLEGVRHSFILVLFLRL